MPVVQHSLHITFRSCRSRLWKPRHRHSPARIRAPRPRATAAPRKEEKTSESRKNNRSQTKSRINRRQTIRFPIGTAHSSAFVCLSFVSGDADESRGFIHSFTRKTPESSRFDVRTLFEHVYVLHEFKHASRNLQEVAQRFGEVRLQNLLLQRR